VTDRPEEVAEAAERLYEHLATTAERPVEREASRLLGEAEAVADDMRDCPPEVIERRAAVVVDLLSEVDGTGDPAADERVAAARELAARLADHAE
jgi:vacuolar-type H+-ATPase subunit H